MSNVRRLQRRANTLLKKSEELLSLAMDVYDVDGRIDGDVVTDFADNIVVAASDMCEVLNRATPLAARAKGGDADG